MQIKDIDKLKEWLLKKLEPLCDADPAALAKYVVALLRKEKPRSALKELCIDQLEVFLAKDTAGFVDQLFQGLDNDAYLKGAESAPNPTPPPAANVERMQSEDHSKRSEVDDEDRDFRRSRRGESGESGPPKRSVTSGSSSGLGRKRGGSQETGQPTVRRRVEYSGSTVNSSGGVAGKRPVRERLGVRQEEPWSSDARGRRRQQHSRSSSSSSSSDSGSSSDSDRKGRGRKRKRYTKNRSSSTEDKRRQRCKDYEEKGMCILGESCPYDHGMDPLVIGGNELTPFPAPPLVLPPHGLPLPPNTGKSDMMIPPVISRPLGQSHGVPSVTEAYNPEDPALSTSKAEFLPVPLMLPMGPRFGPLPPPIPGVAIPPPLSLSSMPPRPVNFNPSKSGLSTFPHPRPFMGGKHKPSDALIVKKIPRDMNTITKISSHFEKFGTIVNIKVRHEGDPEAALVQFSSPAEATKAHNSTEAVLSNRFIKVFYLRQNNPVVSLETPVSVAVSVCGPSTTVSSTVVSSSGQNTNHPPDPTPDSSSVVTRQEHVKKSQPEKKPHPPHVAPSHAPQLSKRQQRKTTEAAKKSLELQKKTQELLQKQIEQQKLLISKLEKTGKQLPPEQKSKIISTLQSLSANISKLKEAATVIKKNAEVTKEDQTKKQQHTESLKKKADALRKEAHELGLLKSLSQPLATGGRGPSLHPKPKPEGKPRKLVVIGAQERDKLTSYFESFGNLEQVEVDPASSSNLIFTFRNAYSANKAVRSGSTFNGKPLIMKWYTPKSQAKPTVSADNASLSSNEEQVRPITAATLEKPDPAALHLAEDSDEDDKEEGRSWKR